MPDKFNIIKSVQTLVAILILNVDRNLSSGVLHGKIIDENGIQIKTLGRKPGFNGKVT